MTSGMRVNDKSEARSGCSPDLVKQRRRDGVSSAADPSGWPEASLANVAATTALDTGGSAPLPAHRTQDGFIDRPLLTADDVATFLRVPRPFVYALARRGELPTVRLGNRYVRFRCEAVEQWISERETTERFGTQ